MGASNAPFSDVVFLPISISPAFTLPFRIFPEDLLSGSGSHCLLGRVDPLVVGLCGMVRELHLLSKDFLPLGV